MPTPAAISEMATMSWLDLEMAKLTNERTRRLKPIREERDWRFTAIMDASTPKALPNQRRRMYNPMYSSGTLSVLERKRGITMRRDEVRSRRISVCRKPDAMNPRGLLELSS
jgi:hypothetical protein